MAGLLASMDTTVKHAATSLLATVLGALGDLAGHKFSLLLTVALHWDTDVAWRARSWVANDLAVAMSASLILRTLTMIPTGVRQRHWIVIWLFPSAAEAEILGQFVLSIGIIAIRTRP